MSAYLLFILLIASLVAISSAFRFVIPRRFSQLSKLSSSLSEPDLRVISHKKDLNILVEKSSGLESISDSHFYDKVLRNEGLAVVFFTSGWCGPCRAMKSSLEKINAKFFKYSNFYEVDTDDNFDAAMEFNVRSIPSVLMFKQGKLVSEIVGAVPESVVVDQIVKNTSSL